MKLKDNFLAGNFFIYDFLVQVGYICSQNLFAAKIVPTTILGCRKNGMLCGGFSYNYDCANVHRIAYLIIAYLRSQTANFCYSREKRMN